MAWPKLARSIPLAVALSAVALPAHADPISGFLAGLLAGVGLTGASAAIGGAAAYIAGSAAFALGSTIGSAALFTAISSGIGLAVKAIAGAGKQPSSGLGLETASKQILDNQMSTTNPIPLILGRSKSGCQRVFFKNRLINRGKRSLLYVVATLAEGPIDAVESVQINGIDANSSFYIRDGLRRVEYWVYNGYPNDWAALVPDGHAPEWTLEHKLTKLAKIVCRFTLKVDNYDMFASLPQITVVMRGARVYDLRDGVTRWSTNPALLLYHFMTSGRRCDWFDGVVTYGFDLPASVMDEQAFIDAANYCDELVDNGTGGTQKRYELNGVIQTENRLIDTLDLMAKSFNAIMLRTGAGLYQPLIIGPKAATFTINEDIILPNSVKLIRDGIRQKYNRAEVQFRNPGTDWEIDTAIYVNSEALALDGREQTLQLDLPFTTNRTTAMQIGQIAVLQSRLDRKLEMKLFSHAITCAVGDVVSVSYKLLNYVNKPFRLMAMTQNVDATVNVTLEEYDPDVYTLGAVGLEDLGDENDFAYPHAIQPPGVISVTQSFQESGAGETINQLTLEWADSESGFVNKYQAQYKLSTETDEQYKTVETTYPRLILNNLPVGSYDVRVRAVNTVGVASDWTKTVAQIVASSADISDVTGFTVTHSGGALNFTWDKNASVYSGGQFRIKCIPGSQASLTPGEWADAAIVDEILDGKQLAVSFPVIEGTWLIKSRTRTGIECVNAARVIVDLPEAQEWQTVQTVTENPSYSGTKTDMVVASSKLKLDTGETVGTYAYSNTVDLGDIYNTRLRAFWGGNYTSESATGFYEDITAFYEDITDFYEDLGSNPTVRVLHEFRSTRDNPASSPIWGPWQRYTVADVAARAFEFRIRVESETVGDNVEIATLGVLVQMRRRTTSGALTTNVAGSAITFDRAFYTAPDASAAMKNAATGDYVAITSESATGFSVQCKNAGGSGVARDVSWLAVGLGEKVS